jgi:hypothetical protein
VLHVIDEVLNPSTPDAKPADNNFNDAVSLPPTVPFTEGVQPETSVYSELTQTTSFVAGGLVTGVPESKSGKGSGSEASATETGGPVEQTANAGVGMEVNALAAVAVGAVAFAMGMQ